MTTKRTSIAAAAAILAATTAIPFAAQAQGNGTDQWSGFYAGLNAGGLWSSTSASIVENNTGGGFNGTSSGFVGGAQAGYNYLIGPVLLGGEIDFQGSTLTGGVTGGAGPSFISATQSIPWFSTFRARVGYPVGSVMPYLTGGAVWGQQRLAGFDSQFGSFDNSNNFWTYTFGGGVEGHINDRWSAKLEYLWIGSPDTPLSTPATTSISERSIGNLVRVGFNYRF
ncbi:MAG TPA: outer membrane beta-barrel protein [Reyranella sp.]|jgi:outer membrane immunogenic protein|nr:outer membrane beta-barrel protein [Reyranella sp.]